MLISIEPSSKSPTRRAAATRGQIGRETPPIELSRDSKPPVGRGQNADQPSSPDRRVFRKGLPSTPWRQRLKNLQARTRRHDDPLVVSLALALSGEIQPGFGEMPGVPNYAPVGGGADRGQLWNFPADGSPTGPKRCAAGDSRGSAGVPAPAPGTAAKTPPRRLRRIPTACGPTGCRPARGEAAGSTTTTAAAASSRRITMHSTRTPTSPILRPRRGVPFPNRGRHRRSPVMSSRAIRSSAFHPATTATTP